MLPIMPLLAKPFWKLPSGFNLWITISLCASFVGCQRQQAQPGDRPSSLAPLPGVEVVDPPQPAPDFTAPQLDGSSFQLSAHRGSVLVLNFWATWCPPCREEIPDLIALQRDLGDRGLLVVGISLDEEGPTVVAPFAQNFKINYPVVLGNEAIADAYGGVFALPTTVVVDRLGRIRYQVLGLFPTQKMRPHLEALLNESTSAS
jgi:thiol-disulfide isomerase/thioredoxin